MPDSPFLLWKLDDAEKSVGAVKHPETETNALFVKGDHWQEGAGWIGPHPRLGEAGATEALTELARNFVSRNVIAEVVERHTVGVAGQEMLWRLTPRRAVEDGEELSDQEQAAIDEAESLLTVWWDKRQAHRILQAAVATSLWATRGPLRLYTPRGLAPSTADGEARNARVTGPEAAFDLIYLEAPSPLLAAVVTDADTKLQAGVLVQEVDGKKQGELSFLESSAVAGVAPKTTLRTISPTETQDFPLELGGRLTMAEITRELLITPQVQQGQRALNLAISAIPMNVKTGAWMERTLLDAQMPGEFKKDPETGKDRFYPGEYLTGPAVTNFVQGSVKGENPTTGQPILGTPQIVYRDPVEITAPRSAKDSHYEDILQEVDQAHILIVSEATPSGRSREQARADFKSSLQQTQATLEPTGRWLLETVLAMAEAYLGKPGKWTKDFRVEFNARLDLGPVSVEERAQNVAEVDKGMLGLEACMERNGVADVDGELTRIAERPERQLALMKQRADVMAALKMADIPVEIAATMAGFDEDQVAAIVKSQTFEEPVASDRPRAVA